MPRAAQSYTGRSVGRVGLTLAIAASVLAVVTASDARPPETSLVVGEVTAQVAGRPEMAPALRGMVEDEVGALDRATLPREAGPTVLSVSLLRIESRTPQEGSSSLEVTCDVSGALRSPRRGGLFAMVEGRASALGSGQERDHLERRALRAAVSSAVSRVTDAMKRRR